VLIGLVQPAQAFRPALCHPAEQQHCTSEDARSVDEQASGLRDDYQARDELSQRVQIMAAVAITEILAGREGSGGKRGQVSIGCSGGCNQS
jgi:hypothetical protein